MSVLPSEEHFGVGPSCDWLRGDQLRVEEGCSFKNARKSSYATRAARPCRRVGFERRNVGLARLAQFDSAAAARRLVWVKL